MFDFDNNQYVNTPVETSLDSFMHSPKSGMFLIGTSGSGKTKSIQHFCYQNQENCIIAATSPKCGYADGRFGINIFLNELLEGNHISQDGVMKSIQDILDMTNRHLVIIFDGLNELNGGFNECVKQYKHLLELMESVHQLKLSRWKVIVSCRDFAFLDYCNSTGLFPQADSCYCETKNDSAVPYYKIPPLSLEQQIEFCNSYIPDVSLRNRFISDLRNNRYIRENFTHPYMIAIAGKCYNACVDTDITLVSDVFAHFTEQMLRRLTQPKDVILAKQVIDSYCSLLLSPGLSNKTITTFLLLNNNAFFAEQDEYARVLKELQDINLFTAGVDIDSIRISHDRIEEYLLADYLFHSPNREEVVGQALKLATLDSIFSCAVEALFNRLIKGKHYMDLIRPLMKWYELNTEIVPVIFVCSLANLDIPDYVDFVAKTYFEAKSVNELMGIILMGLRQALAYKQIHYPTKIFDALDVISSFGYCVELTNYRAYWNYSAAKYYTEIKNDYEKAIQYCEQSLQFCDEDSAIYHIAKLQNSILRGKINDDNGILEAFADLYRYFCERREWEYAAECIINWGAVLRRQTQFEEALKVYQLIDLEN